MQGQPPIFWDHAEGFTVHDRWGNRWVDWSSGVLVTNAGHSPPAVVAAIRSQAERGLLTNYCFPSEIRLILVEKLESLLPPNRSRKSFCSPPGSETVECAVKLCRTHGVKVGGKSKATIVSFHNAFHGRTLGSQQAGGIPALKDWIVNLDPGFAQASFPDGYRCADISFEFFERALSDQGVEPGQVAGVIRRDLPGRRRGLRSAGVHAATPQLVRPSSGAAGVRRGSSRLRQDRYDVGIRTLRHRAGSGLLGQRNQRLHATVGSGRAARRDGPASPRQHDLDPHWKPNLLRGGASEHRHDSSSKTWPETRGA